MRVPGPADDFIVRLDEVRARLARLADEDMEGRLTEPDPDTGEPWEPAQIWSHMVEFIPYWRGEIDHILEADTDEPVPFGRVKTDPERIARIEEGRTVPLPDLWEALQEELGHLKAFVADLSEDQWRREGVHQTRGVMAMPGIVDRFLVDHLEEHADQLEGLVAS